MKYNNLLAICILTAAVLVVIANSFYITQLTISDSDPSTYVVIPLLMLPVLAFFMLRKGTRIDVKRNDILVSVALFILFLALTIYLRVQFSYLFISFRIDMLLMPLVLTALVGALFGFSRVNDFRALFIYPAIASPALMFAVMPLNQAFAVANTEIVYHVIKLFVVNAAYMTPITISANGYSIGIGQTCVGIGALLALVFLLMPVAYFYEGTWVKRILWVLSGFALLVVFNVLRMMLITADWLAYGPSNSVLLIHEFVGILLFYASIIIIMLLAGRYGLVLPRPKKQRSVRMSGVQKAGVLVAAAIALACYLLSLSYSNAFYLSPSNMYARITFNVTNVAIDGFINGIGTGSNYSRFEFATPNGRGVALTLYNSTVNSTNPIVIYLTPPEGIVTRELIMNSTILGKYSYLSNSSIYSQAYELESNGSRLFMYHTVLPYALQNNSDTTAGVYVLLPEYLINESMGCRPRYDAFYTYAFNLFNYPAQQTRSRLDTAYCLGERLIG